MKVNLKFSFQEEKTTTQALRQEALYIKKIKQPGLTPRLLYYLFFQ
jgi:hypothetical protein